jgi:hypothetical protein
MTMGKTEKYLSDAPSEEKPDDDITWIVNSSYDTGQTSEKAENEKCEGHSWTAQEYMECPPACSPEHRMSRGKWIIREVIHKRRETCHSFWTGSHREYLIDNPVNCKGSQDMPEEIERYMFWSVIFQRYSIEP